MFCLFLLHFYLIFVLLTLPAPFCYAYHLPHSSTFPLHLPFAHTVLPHHRPPARRKARLPLPWWCRIIAWIVNILGVFASIAFIFLYGISMGNEKVVKWLTMIFISFGSNIFITSPIKVSS